MLKKNKNYAHKTLVAQSSARKKSESCVGVVSKNESSLNGELVCSRPILTKRFSSSHTNQANFGSEIDREGREKERNGRAAEMSEISQFADGKN